MNFVFLAIFKEGFHALLILIEDFYDFCIYIKEINECVIDKEKLLKIWHRKNENDYGGHTLVNDSENWKEKCPTFNETVKKL